MTSDIDMFTIPPVEINIDDNPEEPVEDANLSSHSDVSHIESEVDDIGEKLETDTTSDIATKEHNISGHSSNKARDEAENKTNTYSLPDKPDHSNSQGQSVNINKSKPSHPIERDNKSDELDGGSQSNKQEDIESSPEVPPVFLQAPSLDELINHKRVAAHRDIEGAGRKRQIANDYAEDRKCVACSEKVG